MKAGYKEGEMAKIKFDQLKRFGDQMNKCTECVYCTFWCPIYQED